MTPSYPLPQRRLTSQIHKRLPHIIAPTFIVSDIKENNSFNFKKYVYVTKCIFCIYSFVRAHTVSEMLKFNIVDLSKVGQDHGEQFSQRYHSMADVKIYKRILVPGGIGSQYLALRGQCWVLVRDV